MNRARRLRQWGTTVALVAGAVLAAGCETEGVSGCMEVPRTALDQLDVRLEDPVAVEAFTTKGPPDLRGDAHYVAGTVDGETAVWIFGERAYDGESGVILAADGPTRKISKVGDENGGETDLGPGDTDYSNVRDCLD